ncbi:MAG: Short-chain dehydrogenase/reductase [Acidimicrobiales bacterium]|nr:Short-chain dehydrogenase/reductase [Acidimicrobiales bacterium]
MTDLDVFAPFRLDGKVAVVTGASSGLGDRFARVLHAAGATVVAAARRLDRLEALAADLGDRVHAVACDVSVDADCERLVATAVGVGGGRLDVLVNNAGTSLITPAEDEPIADFRRIVDVNLNGLFLLCQEAYRPMAAAGSGAIVNIASIYGLRGSGSIKQASYCASKGAVVNLTRELGAQWGRRGIRVNAIAPGWFPSEMTEEMWGDERSEAFVARNAPIPRPGAEHELDGALLFLASDASTYVTGQTLAVDGGWTAR